MPKFRDALGNEISWIQPPERIVSLVPSQTETLFDLGLADRISGVTRFCVHPAEATRDKRVVGGTKDFKLERIEQLQPDLIVSNKEENNREAIEALSGRYPVWTSDVGDFPAALQMIRDLGEAVGRGVEAKEMAARIEHGFARMPNIGPRRVAYLIWREPTMVAGKGTFIDAILRKLGLINVFAGRPRYPTVTTEELRKACPDLVMLSSEPFPFKERHLTEFRERLPDARSILVDGEMFSWYGSRLLLAPAYFRTLFAGSGAVPG